MTGSATATGPTGTQAGTTQAGTTGELPRTMRASVLHAAHDLRVERRPVPVPGPGEVLVRVSAVGTCGSDTHYYRHGRIGSYVVDAPLVLGHEAAGVVVAVGEGVDAGRAGQRVSLEPGVPCRRCRWCRQGRYNLCPDVRFFATPPHDGAFCEYVALDADFAHPVPDALSDDAAALLEPLSVALWAHHAAGTAAGDVVLVTGAGPVGLLVVQAARALGAGRVVASDVDATRRRLALECGAELALDPGAERAQDADPVAAGVDADVLVDCSGVPAAVAAALPAVRAGGAAVLVGMGADEMTLPVSLLQSREVRLTGTFRYANTWPQAIALAADGRVDLDSLVTGHVDLDHVAEALAPDPAQRHVKLVVRPGD